MNNIALGFLAAIVFFIPGQAFAQTPVQQSISAPDNGGRLGVTVDSQSYSVLDTVAVKITALSDTSPLNRIVHIGDYIYRINNTDTKTGTDTQNAVKVLKPHSEVTIYWIDLANKSHPWITTETFTLDINPVPITQPIPCAPYINLVVETGDSINRMRNACSLFVKMDAEFDGPLINLYRKWKPQFIQQRDADRLTLRESRSASEFFPAARIYNTHHRDAANWVANLPCRDCKQPR